MKIFAVIHNYGSSEADDLMGSGDVCWYEMPDSSIMRSGNPFFIPDTDTEYVAFPSLCLRIGRLGKSVSEKFAHRYADAWTMGVAVAAKNRLTELRKASMPWAPAVAFDRSCIIGNLQPIDTLIEYECFEIAHGANRVAYSLDQLIHSRDSIISRVTADNTIKTGDLILVGLTPKGITLEQDTPFVIEAPVLNLLDINVK